MLSRVLLTLACLGAGGHAAALSPTAGVLVSRLFPAGTLTARVEVPRDTRSPASLKIRIQPSQATLSCPLVKGVLQCALPAGVLDLRIQGEGLVPVYLWGVTIQAGQARDIGALKLRPGASVAGWVEMEDDKAPGKSVRVELSPESLGIPDREEDRQRLCALSLETRTKERGFFQLEGVQPGSYVLKVAEDGFAPVSIAPIVVREGLPSELLDPIVLRKPLRLEVAVDPPADPYGQPWKLRLVREREPGESSGGTWKGVTGSEGRWNQNGLAPGPYRVTVLGDRESRWAHQEFFLEAGRTEVQISVPVVPVEGRVLLGDEPLSATLWLGGKSGARRIRFDSDEKGRFAGILPEEGTWPVDLVSEEEGLQLTLEPVEVKTVPGRRTARVEIRVPDTRLAGEVVDEQGRPVPGAAVTVLNSQGGVIRTNEEGEFEFRGLKPGVQGVEAEEGDRSSGVFEVAVEEERETPPLRLVLQERVEVRGRVISAHGGVPGAELIGIPSVELVGFATVLTAVTGPDGEFSLPFPSTVTSFQLMVLAPGYALRMLPATVKRDGLLEIPVETSGGTLILEMTGERKPGTPLPLLVHNGTFTGLPLLSRWVRLQRVPPQAPGRLVIPNMEAGAYSLCVNASPELRQGREPSDGRCVSGVLAPYGELTLQVPSR